MSVRSFLNAIAAAKIQTVRASIRYAFEFSKQRRPYDANYQERHHTSNFRSLGVEQAEIVGTTRVGGQQVACRHAARTFRNDLQRGTKAYRPKHVVSKSAPRSNNYKRAPNRSHRTAKRLDQAQMAVPRQR